MPFSSWQTVDWFRDWPDRLHPIAIHVITSDATSIIIEMQCIRVLDISLSMFTTHKKELSKYQVAWRQIPGIIQLIFELHGYFKYDHLHLQMMYS